MRFRSVDGEGNSIDPMNGVVPIIKELQRGYLQTIGTGFYITRYGLVMTAKHVIEGLASKDGKQIDNAFVCHTPNSSDLILRKIMSASFLKDVDIGVIQADNYMEEYPQNPLMNYRARLSADIPDRGAELVTFAYPENKRMDFTSDTDVREIRSGFYEGKFLRYVVNSENPSLPFSHYETTIRLRGGASGGPVFHKGKVIGVNCRGWDFGEESPDDDNLSYIVPVTAAFPMRFRLLQLPDSSWEAGQLSAADRTNELTIEYLIERGHIQLA